MTVCVWTTVIICQKIIPSLKSQETIYPIRCRHKILTLYPANVDRIVGSCQVLANGWRGFNSAFKGLINRARISHIIWMSVCCCRHFTASLSCLPLSLFSASWALIILFKINFQTSALPSKTQKLQLQRRVTICVRVCASLCICSILTKFGPNVMLQHTSTTS
jgi:hypothetical protein